MRLEQRHIDELLTGARRADRDEAWALARLTIAQGLRQSLQFSREAWAGVHGGELLCVLGVGRGSMLGGQHEPWLLGHERLDRHARAFARASRHVARGWANRYGPLGNWVDARNTRAIRWLCWVGFEIGPPVPHGIDGLPFHHFEMQPCA